MRMHTGAVPQRETAVVVQRRLCEPPSATTITGMDAVDEYLRRLADTAQRSWSTASPRWTS